MMDRDELTRRMIENDADTLRSERNAAQQRAEQAERERDEARHDASAYKKRLDYIRLLVGGYVPEAMRTIDPEAPQAQSPSWTPQTGAEIAASLEGKPPILPADFDIDRAPTVKADDGELTELLDKARDIWDAAGDVEMVFYKRTNYLHAAVGDILDILERLVKWGAK